MPYFSFGVERDERKLNKFSQVLLTAGILVIVEECSNTAHLLIKVLKMSCQAITFLCCICVQIKMKVSMVFFKELHLLLTIPFHLK